MKRTLLFVIPAIFLGTACERHSASSLPEHGGEHAAEHAPAAGATHANEKAPATNAPAQPKEEPKKEAPAAKFFEQQPK